MLWKTEVHNILVVQFPSGDIFPIRKVICVVSKPGSHLPAKEQTHIPSECSPILIKYDTYG